MTGWKSGTITELEELLGYPLQRLICFIHHAELPFGKVFVHYDGPTTGPSSFSGPIGQVITSDVWKLPVVEFSPFNNPALLGVIENLPDDVFKTLNKDHQNFIKLIEAVLTGTITSQWENMKIGAISHARWTNTQSAVLRFYVSTKEPSFELQRIVSFIVYIYAPVFLAVKHFNRAEEAPKLLVPEIMAVQLHCTQEETEIVNSCIQTNGFFAHHENVLFAFLSSEDSDDRKFAVNLIKNLRMNPKKNNKSKKQVRSFKVPKLNFNATSVYNLTHDPLE